MKLLVFISSFSFALTIFVLAERTPEEFWMYVLFSFIISLAIWFVVYSNVNKWLVEKNKKYDLFVEGVKSKLQRYKSDINKNASKYEENWWDKIQSMNKINKIEAKLENRINVLESKLKYYEGSEFTDEIIKKINDKQIKQ